MRIVRKPTIVRRLCNGSAIFQDIHRHRQPTVLHISIWRNADICLKMPFQCIDRYMGDIRQFSNSDLS